MTTIHSHEVLSMSDLDLVTGGAGNPMLEGGADLTLRNDLPDLTGGPAAPQIQPAPQSQFDTALLCNSSTRTCVDPKGQQFGFFPLQ